MSAEIHAVPDPFRYQAWCYDCGKGIDGSRPIAQRWATKHNQDKHQAPADAGAHDFKECGLPAHKR